MVAYFGRLGVGGHGSRRAREVVGRPNQTNLNNLVVEAELKNLSLKIASIGFFAAGVPSLLVATFFDTAPEGTHNIGLMQAQMLWAQFAALCLVIAAILFVGHRLSEKLDSRDHGLQP